MKVDESSATGCSWSHSRCGREFCRFRREREFYRLQWSTGFCGVGVVNFFFLMAIVNVCMFQSFRWALMSKFMCKPEFQMGIDDVCMFQSLLVDEGGREFCGHTVGVGGSSVGYALPR